ncbi:hypothetical protein HBJ58_07370 [Halomonas desiderata]|uniref:hypothetical protein n=1 Tax=Billgrantia desiderata TaxID=52021 RepID=UPI00174AB90B|nr:hypothetical protein [Halomonas desiderata]
MSYIDEKINEHPSLTKAEEVRSLLDVLDGLDLSTEVRESLHRLRRVVDLFLGQVSSADPELTSFQALKSADQQLSKIKQELTQYKANKNVNHITNASSAADSILSAAKAMWVPAFDLDLDQVRDAISSFRKSVGQNARYAEQELAETRKAIESLREEANELKNSIKEQESRLVSVVNEFQSQFSKAEEVRRSDAASALKSEQEKLGKLRSSYEESFDASIENSKTKLNGISEDLSSKAGGVISDLEQLKEKAERLVHVIANTGMVGGYQRVANEERRVGRFWDGVSLLSLAGMVGFAIYAFHGTFDDFNPGVFLARFGVVLTFAALAGYSARQADKHHKVERRNRRVELELASIDPFLAELPDDERNQVKAVVADRLFAREDLQGGSFLGVVKKKHENVK